MELDCSFVWRAGDLELMKAAYTDHRFPKHFHESYVVQVIESGANGLYCDGREYEAASGSILFINPGEVHTGFSVDAKLLRYRCFYPHPNHFEAAPLFTQHVVPDPLLADQLYRWHTELEQERDPLATDSITTCVLNAITTRQSAHKQKTPNEERPAIRIARDYMHANFGRQITLKELADLCALSSFHFLRAFRKAIGLAPAEYLRNIRIAHAKQLLRDGMEIIDTAAECGFFDQSHLNRHFKRLVGITPGQYRAQQ